MFLHLSVILFMGGGSLSVPGVSVQGRVSLSRGSLSGEGVSVWGVSVWGVSVHGVSVRETPVWLRGGGTHPTGMHSCCFIVYLTWSNFVLSLMSCPEP